MYNASVLYWQLLRPFMKANYLRCLAPSLQLLCRQLEEVHEPDVEWRAQLILYALPELFFSPPLLSTFFLFASFFEGRLYLYICKFIERTPLTEVIID